MVKKFNMEMPLERKIVQYLEETLFTVRWEQLKEAISKAREYKDWFNENKEKIQELVDTKRKACIIYQNNQASAALEKEYLELKTEVERITRALSTNGGHWRVKLTRSSSRDKH